MLCVKLKVDINFQQHKERVMNNKQEKERDLPIELEVTDAEQMLRSGQLSIDYFGSENTYYVDSEETRYFCKNYPTLD